MENIDFNLDISNLGLDPIKYQEPNSFILTHEHSLLKQRIIDAAQRLNSVEAALSKGKIDGGSPCMGVYVYSSTRLHDEAIRLKSEIMNCE